VLETLFAFLFKYRPVVFEHGDLVFRPPWPMGVTVLLVGTALALAVAPYATVRGSVSTRQRAGLAALRFGALALVIFALAKPTLIVATVVPQQNFLGVLFDDSRSMQIADGETSRNEVLSSLFDPSTQLVSELADRFRLRMFRFSERADRVSAAEELAFDGRRTDLARALESARRELAAVPLAGLVVVTDGADNASESLAETVLELKATGVPVHVVAVGEERLPRDVEIRRVELPRIALRGSTVPVDVEIAQSGLDGEQVTLEIQDDGRIVGTRQVTLPDGDGTATVRLHFTADEMGPRTIRIGVPALQDEALAENNAVEVLLDVPDSRERILYFEGEPRWELKFLRRAVAEDPNLEVVTLLRSADDKFQRLGVADSMELLGGFPRTREELFPYRALVLGSVEASFFTVEQLRIIRDFVAVRGGGLLTLGGRRSLAEGGYAGTPIADALPVALAQRVAGDSSQFYAQATIEPTAAGRLHPVTQLAGEPEASATRWRELPQLSIVNPVAGVKPGAATLLSARVDGRRDPLVAMAWHRYGRGKSATLAVQDSWIWQMHADIPVEDQTHERFWQQLLRWLVSGVPEPLTVVASSDRVEPGRPVTITATLRDSGYVEVNGAAVTATVTGPDGETQSFPLEWSVERDGEYQGSFTPTAEGLHEFTVEARSAGATAGVAVTHVTAGDLGAEYFGAGMRRELLRNLATETGGRFYTPETVGSLPEDVSFTESGTTVREERSLWDMPAILLALVILLGSEWGYRRSRGLA
jgi:uncharacterized membrane protein